MTDCSICGEKIPEGSRTCAVCGSSADEFLPMATELSPPPAVSIPKDLPPGGSYCPACAKVYGPEYTDLFCVCGTGLLNESRLIPPAAEAPAAPILDEAPPLAPIVEEAPPLASIFDELPPLAPILEEPAPQAPLEPLAAEDAITPDVKVRCVKPPSGTPSLVLYGPDKKPLQYFALTKDAMLIGRLDAVAGNFPDIDLDEWFDRATIRRISRQHALILRSRATSTFVLRPLVGNTGTQLEAKMVSPQQDYPLKPGHRIILGGVIRLKFEIS
jgi:FHA domain